MKKMLKINALMLAAILALSALACSGGSDSDATQPPNTPHYEAMLPPMKWQSLGDAAMLRITAVGKEKVYTGAELLNSLDRGQIIGWDDKEERASEGKPMYFLRVYMKGLIYDACGTIEYENFKTFKLVGMDGTEIDLLKELEGVDLLESVLALQRGAVAVDAKSGCMLVLKSASGDDRQNKIYKGIAKIVIG